MDLMILAVGVMLLFVLVCVDEKFAVEEEEHDLPAG